MDDIIRYNSSALAIGPSALRKVGGPQILCSHGVYGCVEFTDGER